MDIAFAVVSIIAGILVIVWPRVIAYIIGFYLIIAGVLALLAL